MRASTSVFFLFSINDCCDKIILHLQRKGERLLLTHFQWKERKNNIINKEWSFSFFFQGTYYRGSYFKDGTITWSDNHPPESQLNNIENQVHDLILFHIFEDHTPPM
nr:DUF5342 family protein [Salibacterium salarium]